MAWKNYPPYMAKGNKSKYGAKKTVVNGIEFDSKKEAKRYTELHLLETAGAISDLQMQVKFVLIPAQREPDSVGARGGLKKGKVIEREVVYIADFVYKNSSGETVVEDTKGFRTTDYILKRKMMLFFHGIRIVEI
jgi:hypothetical protein